MKRVISIHGWDGSPDEGWRPWLKKELEKKGIEVLNLSMPDPKYPKQDAWVHHLAQVVGKADTETVLVGHSLGAITILRYLETLPETEKVGGVVMLAGFTDDLKIPELSNFFKSEINWEKIKKHCQKFVAIHSDNDPYVALSYGDIFKEKLNAEVIVMHNMKHFSGDDGITELPLLLEMLLSRF